MRKEYYSVGEMAKIHDVTTQTLRFYDKIDLFKPNYVNPSNSYRYYSMNQFDNLTMINYLRSLDMPIEIIKEHLTNNDTNSLVKFFELELQKTQIKIKEFEQIQTRLSEEIIITKNKHKFNIVDTHYFKKRLIDFHILNTSTIQDMHNSFKILRNRYPCSEKNRFGTIIGEASLKKNKLQFHSTFIFVDDYKDSMLIPCEVEEGEYACIVSVGQRDEQSKSLNILLEWIKNNSYEILGDGILILLSHNHSKGDRVLFEIQIPVRLKNEVKK